jgi:hypothetical protein
MIDEQGKGELKLILTLFICMAGLLGLWLIAGQMETDTGEIRISSACAAPGGGSGGNPCSGISDTSTCNSKACCRWDPDLKGGACVDDCPPDEPYCVSDKCVECIDETDCSGLKGQCGILQNCAAGDCVYKKYSTFCHGECEICGDDYDCKDVDSLCSSTKGECGVLDTCNNGGCEYNDDKSECSPTNGCEILDKCVDNNCIYKEDNNIDYCKDLKNEKKKEYNLTNSFSFDWNLPSLSGWSEWDSWGAVTDYFTDPSNYEVTVGIKLIGERSGTVKWYCDSKAGLYNAQDCLIVEKNLYKERWQHPTIRIEIPLELKISAENLASTLSSFGSFLESVFSANIVNLGVTLGNIIQDIINSFTFECVPPPCEKLGY